MIQEINQQAHSISKERRRSEERANIRREKVIVDLLACGLLWPLLDYPKYTRLLRNGWPFVSSGGRPAHILLSREAVNIHAPASTGVLNRNTACVYVSVCIVIM